jgi:hypothetical protein
MLQPSRKLEANPWLYQDDTNVMPVNQPPMDKNAVGNSNKPLQPMNTKRSRFSQSSRLSNQPLSTSCDLPIAMVIILNPAVNVGYLYGFEN